MRFRALTEDAVIRVSAAGACPRTASVLRALRLTASWVEADGRLLTLSLCVTGQAARLCIELDRRHRRAGVETPSMI